MIINVTMNYWAVGGAERFWQRLSKKMPQYDWMLTTDVEAKANLVIYSNDHRFYGQAKKLNKPAIMRLTGPRSYVLPQPDDLSFLVCSSKAGYEQSKHGKKVLIYNGIDFDYLGTINPIECDILVGTARVGQGQNVQAAINYAIKHNRHLTICGGKQHLQENTYDALKAKYPQFTWTGVIDEQTMLGYVKGCKEGIIPSKVHGVSNFALECVACDKPIINLFGVEIPKKEDIDITITAKKYDELIKSII